MSRFSRKMNRNVWSPEMVYVGVLVLISCGIQIGATSNSSGNVFEYCEGSTFEGRCAGPDEIIVMETAIYGRMRIGKCAKFLPQQPCQLAIRDLFDMHCSGQRSCNVRISTIYDQLPKSALPCLQDYRGYLEASYTCVKAVAKRKDECGQRNAAADVSISGTGYLASISTEETGCGSTEVPWVLRTSPGQRIRLKMFDFAVANRDSERATDQYPRVCQVYAVIKEAPVRSTETICGSDDRELVVYNSLTNQVELRLVAAMPKRNQTKKVYYMFRYEVVGCPDLTPAPGQWIARQEQMSSIFCNATGEKWQLRCEAGEWVGERKNCTWHGAAGGSDHTNVGLFWAIFTGSQWAAIAIILGIAITIGLIIFLVGLVYLKRRRPSNLRGGHSACASSHCIPSYHLAHCTDPIPPTPGSKSLQSTRSTDLMNYSSTENDYFRTWQLQRQVAPHCSAPGAATTSSAGVPRCTVLRACPAGQFQGGVGVDPGGMPCTGRRVVSDHIYESPKFERRDLSNPEGADTPVQTPGTPLQYHELDQHGARA